MTKLIYVAWDRGAPTGDDLERQKFVAIRRLDRRIHGLEAVQGESFRIGSVCMGCPIKSGDDKLFF